MHSDSDGSRPVIGHIQETDGSVVVITPDGSKRILQEGDPLYLNDRVISESSGLTSIRLLNNEVIQLGGQSQLVMQRSMLQATPTDIPEPSEVEQIQTAIADGADPVEVSEPSSAGDSDNPSRDQSPDVISNSLGKAAILERDAQEKEQQDQSVSEQLSESSEELKSQIAQEEDEEIKSALAVNYAPTAHNMTMGSSENGTELEGKLHVYDANTGEVLTYSLVTSPSSGQLFLNNDGSFRFLTGSDFEYLAAGEQSVVTFIFEVTDSRGARSQASVDITIKGVNDTPEVAGPISADIIQNDDETIIDLLSRSSDKDLSDTLSVTQLRLTEGNEAGVSIGLDSNSLSIDPETYNYLAEGESETLTYEYQVTGSQGESVPQSVTITLSGTNDQPQVREAIIKTSDQNSNDFNVDLLAGVFDIDATDTLNVVSLRLTAGDPAGITIADDGNSLSVDTSAYEHLAEGESDEIEYSYEIDDGHGGVVSQSASISIEGVNDNPEDLDLDGTQIDENHDGAVVGSLSTTDKNLSDTHSYSVDDNRFEVVDGDLKLKDDVALNYETEGSIDVEVTTTDVHGAAYSESFTVKVNDINEAPVSSDSSATIDEDSLYRFSLNDFPYNDEDNGDQLETVVIESLPANGSLELNGTPISEGDAISRPDISAGLLTFLPESNESSENYTHFNFRVNDGELSSDIQTFTFDVTPIADTPSFSLNASEVISSSSFDYEISIQEDTPIPLNLSSALTDTDGSETYQLILSGAPAGSILTDGNQSITANGSDIDISSWQQDTLRLTPSENSHLDFTLTFTATASESANNDQSIISKTLHVDLSGTVTEDDAVTLTTSGNLTVTDIDDNESEFQADTLSGNHGQLSIVADGRWTYSADNNQSAIQELGQGDSLTDSFTILTADGTEHTVSATIRGTNDAPVVTAGGTLTYTENDGAQAVDAHITLADIDSVTIDSATISISSNFSAAEDSLAFTDHNGISGHWDSLTGSITLSGTATVAQYQEALRTVTYSNSSESPSTADRTISFSVDDGHDSSNIATSTITVTAVNDAPDTEDILVTSDEDAPYIFTTSDFTFSDPDARQTLQSIKITQLPSAGELLYNGSAVTADMEVTKNDLLAGRLRFEPAENENGNLYASFEFQVSDGELFSSSATFDFSIIPVNDDPTVSAAIAESFVEDSASVDINLLDYAADVDTGDTLSVTQVTLSSGNDSGITINGNTLTVDPDAYDYLPDGVTETIVYSYDIEDGNGGSVSQTATLVITGTNDSAQITGLDTATVTEGSHANTLTTSGSLTASDADQGESQFEPETLTGNYGDLVIGANGQWTYTADNTLLAIQGLDDGDTLSETFTVTTAGGDTHNIDMTIAGTNDAPVIGAGMSDQTATEEQAFSYQLPSEAFSDIDGDSLTYSATLNDGSPLPSWVTFNPSTGTFSGTPDDPDLGQIIVKVTASDGDLSTSGQFKINVAAVNDPPELQSSPLVDDIITALDFNTGAGLLANDLSTEGNDASFSGSVNWVSGHDNTGSAFNMDGSEGHAELQGLSTGGAMTISAWVQFDSFDEYWSRILDFGNGQSDNNIVLGHTGSNSGIGFHIYSGGADDPKGTLEINNFFTAGEWVHITATVEADGTMSIYRNGELAGQADGVVPEEMVRTGNFLGKSHWPEDGYLDGSIDELVIANGAVSADQAKAIYQADTVNNLLSDSFHVEEHSISGTEIGTVSATDVDNPNLSYSLTDDASGRFTIDSDTGMITVATSDSTLLDHETAGSHNISVQVSDGSLTDTRTYTIYLTDTNDTPDAQDETVSTLEDSSYTFTSSDFNFSDADQDDSLSQIRIENLPENGELLLNGVSVSQADTVSKEDIESGLLTFKPALNANGDGYDSFSFSVADQQNVFSLSKNVMTVDVTAVNDTPVVSAGISHTVNEDQTITLTEAQLLVNASDIDGDTLSVSNVRVDNGSVGVTDNGNGTWTITPVVHWSGTSQLSFDISDGNESVTNTLSLAITPDADAPSLLFNNSAQNATVSANEDTSIALNLAADLTDTDGSETLDVLIEGLPTGAEITDGSEIVTSTGGPINISSWNLANLSVTPIDHHETDFSISVTATATELSGGSTSSTTREILIDIQPQNDSAIITGIHTGSVTEDDFSTYGPLGQRELIAAGDLDIQEHDAGEAAFQAETVSGSYGDLTINSNGQWEYIADSRQSEIQALGVTETLQDTLTVQSLDGTTHDITITIQGANDQGDGAPLFLGSLAEDNTLVINESSILNAVSDIDGDTLTVTAIQLPVGGHSIVNNNDGTWTLTPAQDFNGMLEMLYVVSDGTLGYEVNNLVRVNITSVADTAVISGDDTASLTEDTVATLTASGSLSVIDPDAGEAVFSSETINGNYGDLAIDSDGNWSYSADNSQAPIQQLGDGDSLSETFTVQTADGTTKDITITLNGTNDAPTVSSAIDLGNIDEDTSLTITEAQLLANASDIDGDSLSVNSLVVADSNHGSVTDNGNGTWTFTPAANFNGDNISFNFIVSDGHSGGDSNGTAVVDINALADNPVISPDTSETTISSWGFEDTVIGSDWQDVNASPEGWSSAAGLFEFQRNGADSNTAFEGNQWLELDTDQTLDTISYQADTSDGQPFLFEFATKERRADTTDDFEIYWNGEQIATITPTDRWTVHRIELPPTGEDTTSLEIRELSGANDFEGSLLDDLKVLKVGITPSDDPAYDFSITSLEDTGIPLNLGTVTSGGTESITTHLAGIPTGSVLTDGTHTVNADGSNIDVSTWNLSALSLTPPAHSHTDFTITIASTATEGNGDSASSSSSLRVELLAENDSPTAINLDSLSVSENSAGAVVGSLSTSDADSDDSHSYSVNDNRFEIVNGQLKLKDGVSLDYETEDSITLNVTTEDTEGVAYTENFTLSVADTNDAPVTAGSTSHSVDEDNSLTITKAELLANTTDADGDNLSVSNVQVTSGQVSVTDNGNNTWTLTPSAEWSGNGQLSFDISDGTVTVSGQADMTVTAVADTPDISITGTTVISSMDFNGGLASGWTSEHSTEIHNDGGPVGNSNSGTNVAELDGEGSGTPDAYYYSVDTSQGHDHQISLWVKQRESYDGTDEIEIVWNGQVLQTIDPGTSWQEVTINLPYTDQASTQLAVREVAGQNNGVGPLLDQITISRLGADDSTDPAYDKMISSQEDTRIALDLGSSLNDSDGSESLSVSLSGIPSGFALTDGTNSLTTDGSTVDASSWNLSNLTITPVANYDSDFTITVTSTATETSNNDSATHTQTIRIDMQPVSDAAIITGDDSGSVTEDAAATLSTSGSLSVSDVDGSASFVAETVNGSYGSLTISTDGNWTYSSDNDQSSIQSLDDGEQLTDSITISSNDGTTHTVEITIQGTNDAPLLANAVTDQSVNEDSSFSFTVPENTFSHGDGDTLTFTATQTDGSALPEWLNFNTSTRVFSGTPDNDDVATLNLKVTATDEDGETIDASFSLIVNNINDAPSPVFAEDNGLVSIEAEHFSSQVNRSGNAWAVENDASASGGQQVSTANNGADGFDTDYTGISSELTYDIQFESAGTYYVWVRGDAPDGNSDSVHIGLNGEAVSTGSQIGFNDGSHDWAGDRINSAGRITIEVDAPGTHQLNLWMREDGTAVDKIVISDDVDYVPSGSGPAESDYVGLSDQTATEEAAFSYTLPANAFSDDDGDSLTFSTSLANGDPLPAWLTFDTGTRTFSGIPDDPDVGSL
ncbi:retention module-containing protein, partial [Endozoicomonas numazuensis]